MSLEAILGAFQQTDLEPKERFVLAALGNFMSVHDPETFYSAWPSIATLMEFTGLSEPTVRRALQGAEGKGRLNSEPYSEWAGPANKRPNRYVLTADFWGITQIPPFGLGVSDRASGVSHRRSRGITVIPNTVIDPVIETTAEISEKETYASPSTPFSALEPLPPRADKKALLDGVAAVRAALRPDGS